MVQIKLQHQRKQVPAPKLYWDCFKIGTDKQNVPKFIKTARLKKMESIYSPITQQNIDTQTELKKPT